MIADVGPGEIWSFAGALAWFGVFWRGRLWRDQTLPIDDSVRDESVDWPAVTAVVPARDEAAVIGDTVRALLAQDYPGPFAIVLVDDESADGTADIAHAVSGGDPRLIVLAGGPRPPGWTGKLWAVSRGIAAADAPRYLWLTDADIVHTPDTLRALVRRSARDGLALNSRMALLRTESLAERAICPAFVYFFDMLYPFVRVNDPGERVAAAAGGCMLIERTALQAQGGIGAIRTALIDDCAMGALMKQAGAIRLSLTRNSRSVRGYDWTDLFTMIARSAYAQLGYSPLQLLGSVIGMVLLFSFPVIGLAVFAKDGAWLSAVVLLFVFGYVFLRRYREVLAVYREEPLWIAALPLIALFFIAATIWSAIEYYRGRGGMWKGRAQAIAPGGAA